MIIFVIKEIRENKNITLYRLSKLTGLSRTYLRNLENNINANPTVSVLEKISIALNVDIKDLFYSDSNIVESLRDELHSRIDNYGINSKNVLEISQIIDFILNKNN